MSAGFEIQPSETLSPIASAVMILVGAGLVIAGKRSGSQRNYRSWLLTHQFLPVLLRNAAFKESH